MRREDEDARQQEKLNERDCKLEKAKLASAKVQLQIEKVRKDSESKKFKVAEANARIAKLNNTSQQKMEKLEAEQWCHDMKHKFASAYARKLKSMSSDRTSVLKQNVGHLLARSRKHQAMSFPKEFWSKSTEGLRMVVVHHVSPETKVYASENFSWILLNEKRPQELSTTHGSVVSAFAKVLERCLPSYSKLARRWPAQDLLKDSNAIADLAFVRGVWVYSQLLGPEKFPEGIFSWPPDVSMLFSPSRIGSAQSVAPDVSLSSSSSSTATWMDASVSMDASRPLPPSSLVPQLVSSTGSIATRASQMSVSTAVTRPLPPPRVAPKLAMRPSKLAKPTPPPSLAAKWAMDEGM